MSDPVAEVDEAIWPDSRAGPEQPLAPGEVVGEGAHALRIARALPGPEPLVNGYVAVAADGSGEVWLREASGEGVEGLLREREILQALDAADLNRSLLPRVVAWFDA